MENKIVGRNKRLIEILREIPADITDTHGQYPTLVLGSTALSGRANCDINIRSKYFSVDVHDTQKVRYSPQMQQLVYVRKEGNRHKTYILFFQ